MCIHEFYRSNACGHHFPKLRQPARAACFNDPCPTISIPQSLTCTPVKLALKFYHDQVVYLPADMNCGSKVEIPRSCPIVHDPPNGMTREVMNEAIRGQWIADCTLNNAMIVNGLWSDQKAQIERDAKVPDRCSNRAKPGDHNPVLLRRHKQLDYPRNLYAHVQAVKVHQERDRRHMMPNVIYFEVDFGCGGPFTAQCLTSWDGIRLFTHRLHLWGDGATHQRPCNDECLAGWSGDDLDEYRREMWPGDVAIGHRDTKDYPASAKKRLVTLTQLGKQWWSPLDYSNISHRHTEQWKSDIWDGSKHTTVPQLRSKPVSAEIKVPECVWVPVPDRLHKILKKEEPKEVETPEMADRRTRAAWDVIKAKIAEDHPPKKENAVVKECQTTSNFVHKKKENAVVKEGQTTPNCVHKKKGNAVVKEGQTTSKFVHECDIKADQSNRL